MARVEVYGGYSLLRPNLPAKIGGGDPSVEKLAEFVLGNVLGWNGGATVNLGRSVGITADVSGYYKSIDARVEGSDVQASARLHSFLFGPRFTRRGERVRPFAHIDRNFRTGPFGFLAAIIPPAFDRPVPDS